MVQSSHLETCISEAGKELRARTRLRDSWLKIHLFGQAAIIGLALGIKTDLTIVKPAPAYAALAPALSLMFCLFHGVQDDLVAGLSRYLASLSRMSEGPPTWHGSTMIRDFYSSGWAPKMKLSGLIIAFVCIPGILAAYSIAAITVHGFLFWSAIGWTTLLLLTAASVCVICYKRRSDLGQERISKP
jgi:hypothetical protein